MGTPLVVTQASAGASAWIPLDDTKNPFQVGFGVVATGTLTYTIEHTFDNVQDPLITPTAFPNTGATAQTGNVQGNYTFPVTAVRINVTSFTSGSVTLTLVQGTSTGSGFNYNPVTGDDLAAELAAIGVSGDYPLSPSSGYGKAFDILQPGVLSDWNSDYSAGITISLDANMPFNGTPSIRVDIAPGTSGFKILCGITTVAASVPYQWDLKRLFIAMKTTNKTLFSAISAFVGDSTLANNWAFTIPVTSSYLATNYLNVNEWTYFRNIAAASQTGTPAVAQKMRSRLTATISASGSAETIWIGQFGVMPKRKRPTLILCTDDGNSQNYSFMKDLLLHYEIPMSFAINCGRLNTSTFMTNAQVVEMQNHPSRLFDMVNHSYTPLEYSTSGASACLNDYEQNRVAMRAMGLPDLGSRLAVYPSGEFDDDLIKLLQSAGYYGARAVNYAVTHTMDQLWSAGDKGAFISTPVAFSDSAYSVSDMFNSIATNTANTGAGHLMFHRWGDSVGSVQWTYDMAKETFARLAAGRDAGTYELVSYSRHMANVLGLNSDRR